MVIGFGLSTFRPLKGMILKVYVLLSFVLFFKNATDANDTNLNLLFSHSSPLKMSEMDRAER